MPRIARITVENAYYHIITRGNQKQRVFIEPEDHNVYLSILLKYKNRYKFKLFCYCLMPNHVHLVIQVVKPKILSKAMKCVNLSYAVFFNSKYNKVGHLWQDRFKSKVIEKEDYLLGCIDYIENNPVRVSLASNIAEYPWSSYNARVSNTEVLDSIFSI